LPYVYLDINYKSLFANMAASHAQDRQDKKENSRLNYKQQTANMCRTASIAGVI